MTYNASDYVAVPPVFLTQERLTRILADFWAMVSGFTPAGTFRTEAGIIISYSAPNYYGSNAYQTLYTDTDLDDLMTTILAAGYKNIYFKTMGTTFTWNTDSVAAALTLEADLAEYFVIKHSTPDVLGSYISVGANTMLKNMAVWDYGGVAISLPDNRARPFWFYYNATTSAKNISVWDRQPVVIDIGDAGLDRPGIAVNEYGTGDNFYVGVKENGIGVNVQVDDGSPANTGIGVNVGLYCAGKALYLNSSADATGILAYLRQAADIPAVYVDSTVDTTSDITITTNAKTTGQQINLYQVTSTFGGIGILANYAAGGVGTFNGKYLSFLNAGTEQFSVGNDGAIYIQSDCKLLRGAANRIDSPDQIYAQDGLVTKTAAHAITDADFTVDSDGCIAIDSANARIYYRYSGAWHYSSADGGFQIPKEEKTCSICHQPIVQGQFVCGQIESEMSDGALHGLWVHLKCVT